MSKELKKFNSDHAKIEAKLKNCKLATVEKLVKEIRYQQLTRDTGINQLGDDIATAQAEGIVGKKIEDYAKHKDVLSTFKVLKKTVADQLNGLNEIDPIIAAKNQSVPALTKLKGDIDKDLSKRKDKSKTKQDIEKLQKTIADRLVEMSNIGKKYALLNPGHKDPVKFFNKELTTLIAKNPADLAAAKYATMAPRKMDTRILKGNVNKCMSAFKKIKELCLAAKKEAEVGNKESLVEALKKCKVELKTPIDLSAEYTDIKKNFKAAIDNSKDKAIIIKSIDTMVKVKLAAEKLVSDTTKEIRKISG